MGPLTRGLRAARLRPGSLLGLLLATAIATSACATNPRELPTLEQLDLAAQARSEQIAGQDERLTARTLQRMRAKQAVATAEEPAVFDVLMLSGGGQYGAFGAGVLRGWGELEADYHLRPNFDLVTGVSTGSLISPFVFNGTEDEIRRVERFYREVNEELAVLRGLLFFLPWRDSFFDVAGLQRTLRKEIKLAEVEALREGHAEGRSLLVATTDLDLGAVHIWDLGYEMQQCTDDQHAVDRLRRTLRASSSIPAVFPPVEIDGSLHVDGGVAEHLFLPTTLLESVGEELREGEGLRVRIWVIVNGKVKAARQPTEATWPSIARRSYQVAMRFAVASELRHAELFCRALDAASPLQVEFRYIALPEEFTVPQLELKKNIFDSELMGRLFDLGQELGRNPGAWSTVAPLRAGRAGRAGR